MSIYITLADEEAVLLDGRVSDADVQAKIDGAKARLSARNTYDLPDHLADLVADVVHEAETNGELRYQHTRVNRCPACKLDKGYVKFKSGPRKGQPNYDRRLTMPAVEFAYRFVSFQGSVTVGACADCIKAALPTIREALRGVRVQLPSALQVDGEPVFRRYDRKKCSACGWTGHAGEMVQLPAVMGGSYPGGCPACDAENRPFGKTVIERVDGFEIVPQNLENALARLPGASSGPPSDDGKRSSEDPPPRLFATGG